MRLHKSEKRIFVIGRKRVYAIDFSDLLYIERIANKSVFQLVEREVIVDLPLSKIIKYLPQSFIRSHKSFIINKEKIVELNPFNNNTVEILFSGGEKTALITKDRIEKVIN